MSLDSTDDNPGILKHGFKTTKSQSMITDLQNDRSLFVLNRHDIFKLLSKKNISAIFLVENDFETGRNLRPYVKFWRFSRVVLNGDTIFYLTVLLKWKDCVDRNFVLICKTRLGWSICHLRQSSRRARSGPMSCIDFCGFRRLWSLICLLKHTHYSIL